jgi:hypothetical protein
VVRFVFLVLHTPTAGGEVAQERFSEGTLLTDLVAAPEVLGHKLLQLSHYWQAKPNSQNLLNIATLSQRVNRGPAAYRA